MSEFKYDIAISFLKEDEQLALNISKRIDNKFDVFVYSKRQDELAGTDGQNTFSEVFKTKSRAVLVLYRKNWGKTKWTRVEETAIKDRWFNKGHDFLLLVPIEDAPLPKWYPETRIYYDFRTFKLDGLPPVIYSHLKRNGATEKTNSLESTIQKIETSKKYEANLEKYLRSNEATEDFNDQIEKITSYAKNKVKEINENYEKVNLELTEGRNKFIIRYNNYELNFHYRSTFKSTQKMSDIKFEIFKGYHIGYLDADNRPSKIHEERYLMSKDNLGNIIWKSTTSNDTSLYDELFEKKLELIIKWAN